MTAYYYYYYYYYYYALTNITMCSFELAASSMSRWSPDVAWIAQICLIQDIISFCVEFPDHWKVWKKNRSSIQQMWRHLSTVRFIYLFQVNNIFWENLISCFFLVGSSSIFVTHLYKTSLKSENLCYFIIGNLPDGIHSLYAYSSRCWCYYYYLLYFVFNICLTIDVVLRCRSFSMWRTLSCNCIDIRHERAN